MYDFIVVGGGIAGAGVADALAPHVRVALVEAEAHAGYHSTGRSAALFAPSYGSPVFRALTRASRNFLHEPPHGFTDHPLLADRGILYIARPDQVERLEQLVSEVRPTGSSFERLDAIEARALVPLLRSEYLAAAAFEPDARDIDVDALLQGFMRRAKALGAAIFMNARMSHPTRRNGCWHLTVNGEDIAAPVIVNAAGAWADEVATYCGALPIGLRPLRRSAAIIPPPEGVATWTWPAIIDIDEQFYAKPDARMLLVSPAEAEPVPPGDVYAEDLAIATAIDRVQRALDINVTRIIRSWAGLRTFSPDHAPVIGYDLKVPGFFWCAGQGGYGIQSAPALSCLAAALARCEQVPDIISREGVAPADVSPQRFDVRKPVITGERS